MPIEPDDTYDPVTIAFHWAVALIVLGQWTAGQTLEILLPKGPLRSALWTTHVVVGFALVVLLIGRVVWRRTGGRHLPGVGSPGVRLLAASVHGTLYALLFLVVALGIANAFNRGYDIYGWFHLPQIGDKELKHRLTDLHGLAANLLMLVALVHASAALIHHFWWRDAVLGRMLPLAARR